MSIWNNKWSCPGWVFCPWKPHPFGNEYHTICCGESGVMFKIEMVEGNDRPRELNRDPPNKRTVGLLLRLCKDLYNRGKVVILDSGFCVLEGLIELKKKGVFAGTCLFDFFTLSFLLSNSTFYCFDLTNYRGTDKEAPLLAKVCAGRRDCCALCRYGRRRHNVSSRDPQRREVRYLLHEGRRLHNEDYGYIWSP